jgi:hypothetical protein
MSMLAAAALGMVVTLERAAAQDPMPAGDPEVQARGPVHEAFAAPVGVPPEPTAIVAKGPPDAIEEMPAEQKPDGDNMQWIPGYWGWDHDRKDYMWVSGFWRAAPPGRTWVPGHWNEVAGGWQWVPGIWQGAAVQEVSYLPAPPPPVQAAPSTPAPNPDDSYVQGHWVWRGDRYVWLPGYWVTYRPGWVWVPAAYTWTPAGYVYVEGYWDYPLRERGLLFAPVVIDVRLYRRPGYVYRPSFVIVDDNLYGALFVQPSCRHYYYGDYFAVGYRSSGFVAWCDFGGHCGGDPLFAYYRWNYRNDPGWHRDLRACYVGRFNGTIAPPPRVYVNNVTIVNNTTIINNRFAARTTTVVTLKEVQTRSTYKLSAVSAESAMQHARAAKEMRVLATERRTQEVKMVAGRPAGSGPPKVPQVAKLNVPAAPAGVRAPPAAHTAAPAIHAPTNATTPAPHPSAPAGTGAANPSTAPGTHPAGTTPGTPGATTAPGTKPGTPAPPAGRRPAPPPPHSNSKEKDKDKKSN